MISPVAFARKSLNGLYELCTGRSDYAPLNDGQYRERILVMTSTFWLLLVLTSAIAFPLAMDMRPEGAIAANILFVSMAAGVFSCLVILRTTGRRTLSANVMLTVGFLTMAAACLAFGGTRSPTYPLMILAPILASIVGTLRLAITWTLVVLATWVALLVADRGGVEFLQIIVAENRSTATMLALAGSAVAIVSVIVIYAEMNKSLRQTLHQSNSELVHLSSHDQLTLLPNRRLYEERIPLILQRAAHRSSMVGVFMIDLNGFKQINDTYGHGAGDKLLTTVAERIKVNLRETDLVARLGGDEFVAVVEDMKSPDQITRIARKLSQALEQPVSVRQQPLNFSASIGVSIFPVDGRQQHELEEKADKAMYLAKQRGIGIALSSLEDTDRPIPVKPHLKQI